jgi:hypothetical protein
MIHAYSVDAALPTPAILVPGHHGQAAMDFMVEVQVAPEAPAQAPASIIVVRFFTGQAS